VDIRDWGFQWLNPSTGYIDTPVCGVRDYLFYSITYSAGLSKALIHLGLKQMTIISEPLNHSSICFNNTDSSRNGATFCRFDSQ